MQRDKQINRRREGGMGRWETVNTGVRLQVESYLQMALVTLNLHVQILQCYIGRF